MAWKRKSDARDGKEIRYTTIKARLCPTPEQAELFEKTFGCCRYIWNRMLSDQQRFYLETGAHFIPTPAKYKNDAPFLKEVDNQALIQEHNKLSQAFRVFFKNPESFGYPRFKRKKDDRDSFTACNHVFESGPKRENIMVASSSAVKRLTDIAGWDTGECPRFGRGSAEQSAILGCVSLSASGPESGKREAAFLF